jgi:hypothetical protein
MLASPTLVMRWRSKVNTAAGGCWLLVIAAVGPTVSFRHTAAAISNLVETTRDAR